MGVDAWQLAATASGMLFNVSFVSQIRLTIEIGKADGLSMTQWLCFAVGSLVFVGFYANLNQWMMAGVSMFGLACCLTMMFLIYKMGSKESCQEQR